MVPVAHGGAGEGAGAGAGAGAVVRATPPPAMMRQHTAVSRRVTLSAPPAELLAKIQSRSLQISERFQSGQKSYCTYVPAGARIAVWVAKKIAYEDGCWAQYFIGVVLNPRAGIKPEDTENELIQDVPATETVPMMPCPQGGIMVKVGMPKLNLTDEYLAKYPQPIKHMPVEPFAKYYIAIEQAHKDSVVEGTVCMLDGFVIKATRPKNPDVSPIWRINYNCSKCTSHDDVTMPDFLPMLRHVSTSELSAPDLNSYNPEDKFTRFGQEPITISVDPSTTAEDLLRTGSRVTNVTMHENPGTFLTDGKTKEKAAIAALRFRVDQLVKGGKDGEYSMESYIVGCDLWKETLAVFGFSVNDTQVWAQMAPIIFNNLRFMLVGYIDYKNTIEHYGGATSDEWVGVIEAPIHINSSLFVPDIPKRYREIGVPLSVGFVAERYGRAFSTKPPLEPGQGYEGTDVPPGVADLPAVVCLDSSLYAHRCPLIFAYAASHPGAIEFRAIFGIKPSSHFYDAVCSMSEAEGDAFTTYVRSKPSGLPGDPNLKALEAFPNAFEIARHAAVSSDTHFSIFAFFDHVLPADARAKRAAYIEQFTGNMSTLGDALAITNGESGAAGASPSTPGMMALPAPSPQLTPQPQPTSASASASAAAAAAVVNPSSSSGSAAAPATAAVSGIVEVDDTPSSPAVSAAAAAAAAAVGDDDDDIFGETSDSHTETGVSATDGDVSDDSRLVNKKRRKKEKARKAKAKKRARKARKVESSDESASDD